MDMVITTGKSVRNTDMAVETVSWADFVARLSNTIRTPETVAEYFAMGRDEQSDIKDRGWYIAGYMSGDARKKGNLVNRCAVTLDIDHVPDGNVEAIKWAFNKYEFVLHSTHKHTPESPRLRLILPLDSVLDKSSYAAVARAVASTIDMDIFDDTTFQESRVMHYPTTAADGEYVFVHNRGAFINAEGELARRGIKVEDTATWPKSSRVDGIRKAGEKVDDPRNKPGVIGAFCRAFDIYDVIEMTGAYVDGEGGRFTYVDSTSSSGAVVYDNGLFMFSNHESDPCGGRLVNAFDLWRIHSHPGEDIKKAIKEAAKMEEVIKEMGDEVLAPQVVVEPTGDWRDELQRDEKTGAVKGGVANAHLVFANDPALSKNVAFNGFSGDTVLLGAMPWHRDGFRADKTNGTHFDNVDGHMLKEYIRQEYGAVMTADVIEHATVVRSNANYFHPVRDYLESVEKKWDGVERVERLFVDYLGAADNAYNRAIARKMMAAACARVFEPGIKFDQVVVIEGRQGIRKSTFIQTLARKWFSDGIHAIGGKEAIEAMRGKWILEIAELSALGKREVEAVKAFVTVQSDRMRPAYARRTEDFPRQCIFIGTTNKKDYLKDVTGNRRWWPVAATKQIDIEKLEENIDMIWAEAVFIYKLGEPLFLECAEVRAMAEAEQEARMAEDIVNDMIADYLEAEVDPGIDDGGDPAGVVLPRMRVCIRQIVAEVFPHAPPELTRFKTPGDIGALLRKLGWVSAEEAGGTARYYSKKWGRQRFFVRQN